MAEPFITLADIQRAVEKFKNENPLAGMERFSSPYLPPGFTGLRGDGKLGFVDDEGGAVVWETEPPVSAFANSEVMARKVYKAAPPSKEE